MRALALVFVVLGVLAQDADEQYAYVAALAEKGLHEQVVKEAQSFLREHADHAKADVARYRLACALFELHREGEAREHFAALAKRRDFEFLPETQFRLAQCLLAAGEREGAEAALAKVVASSKEYLRVPALALLAQSELARKDHARALEHFTQLEALAGAKADDAQDARCGKAWCLYRLGRRDEALAAARAASEKAGSRAGEMRFLEGECRLDAGDAKGALDAYRAVGKDGAFADAAARGAGFALAAQGDHRGAAREFARVLERFPDSPYRAECALQQGVALVNAGDARAATEALARPELESNGEALAWRAKAEAQSGDSEAALATLQKALATKPARELEQRLRFQRAEVLAKLGRGDEAQKEYERVGSDRALLSAAVSQLEAKRWNDAARLAASLLERFPDSPLAVDALLALGEGLFGAQRWSDAEEAFAAAAESDRDATRRTRALSRAAWSAYLGGQHARAIERFDAVARPDASGGVAPDLAEVEEAAFMAGRAREDAHDEDGARASYASAAKRFPRGPHADEAGMRALLLDRSPEAIAKLDALARRVQSGPLAPRILFELGERQASAGATQDAVASYRGVLLLEPAPELAQRARYGLAWNLYQLGRHADCEKAIAELVATKDAPPAILTAARELGTWCALKRNDVDAALARFQELLASEHDGERAGSLLRAVDGALVAAKRPDDARAVLDAYEKTARTPQERARVELERAFVLADSGSADEAEKALARAERAGGDDALLAEARFRVGEARFAEGADARAIPLYDAAARSASAPLAASALYKAGFARLRSNDAAGAARSFGALVEKHPKSELFHESLFLLGEARYRQDEIEPAAHCFERVLKEAPRHQVAPKALFRLGLCRGRLEQWKACNEALGELVRTQKDFANLAEAELWRGRALANLDDARGARSAFERVIALDKGLLSAQAHLEVGRLAFEAGDSEGALSEFLKVAVLYAGDEEVCEALVLAGQVLEKQGKDEQARAQYREALEKHPKARHAREAKRLLDAMGSR